MMPDDFDPYLEWLGIAPYYRPPNHYQLLGVTELESDLQAIAAAADARMAEIRKYQMGPRGRHTQKLLNELAAARVCLLNASSKSVYDAGLLQKRYPTAPTAYPLAGYAPAPPMPAPPMAVPVQPPPVAAASAEHDEEPQGEGFRWWLPLGALFLLMIIGTSVGLFVLNQRNKPKPIAKAEPNREVEEQEAEEQPESANPRLSPEDTEPVLQQEGNGDLSFSVAAAELSEGLRLVEQAGPAVVSGWRDETTVARWKFKVLRPAIFQVQIKYAVDDAADAQWQLLLKDDTKARSIQTSTTGDAVVIDEFFWRVPRGGEQTLELSVTGLPSSAKLTLHSLRFLQPSQRQ